MTLPCTTETLLKRTTSRCPVCHASVPAEVWKVDTAAPLNSQPSTLNSRVFLRRVCPEHGRAEACIASDARFYWLAQGDPKNACCGGGACSASDGVVRGTLGRNAAGTMQSAQCSVPSAQTSTDDAGCGSDVSLSRERAPSGLSTDILSTEHSPAAASDQQPATSIERLSTCLALIEIVRSCNLACPTCYADSPQSRAVDAVPFDELKARIQGVVDRKGGIEILQLSGGEPTLHPQFFELLAWLHAHPGIDYVLLNTNGVRIANDDDFLAALGRTFRPGKFQLYLQFDGTQEAAQRALRGADLRATRERAIERCGKLGIPVTLAMTVTPENLPHAWDAVEFGLRWEHVRGVSFQPFFGSGRVAGKSAQSSVLSAQSSESDAHAGRNSTNPRANEPPPLSTEHCALGTPHRSLNTADVILSLLAHSAGRLRADDFTPLPCGDPNCATIGYLLKIGGTTRSISDFVDFTQVQDFLRDKVRYSPDDLARCGCENEPLGELLHALESGKDAEFKIQSRAERDALATPGNSAFNIGNATFRLFIKPFMDAWTWDEDRIDRCCTHVIRPDGKLDSFCRYYSGFADMR